MEPRSHERCAKPNADAWRAHRGGQRVTGPMEIAANGLATASILLAGRNSVHTWWIGILGCALFALVFERAQLYADAGLQLFFIVASAVGWWQWLRGGVNRDALPIRRTSRRALVVSTLAGALAAVGYGSLLYSWTDAVAPFPDSMVLSFSVLAQFLLMQRRLETWPVWLVVNTVAVPLFASRGLYLTSALYAVYWINALVSWRHWRRVMDSASEAQA